MELKLTKKIFIVLIITIITNIILLPTVNFADDYTAQAEASTITTNEIPQMVSPIENPDEYDPTNTRQDSPVTTKLTAKVVRWLRNFGVIVGVIVLTLIGVKYMLAAGAEEKAQYKETLIPVVIGVVMLIGSLTLISAIAGLFD